MPLSFRELQAQLQPGWGCEQSGGNAAFDVLVVPSLSVMTMPGLARAVSNVARLVKVVLLPSSALFT